MYIVPIGTELNVPIGTECTNCVTNIKLWNIISLNLELSASGIYNCKMLWIGMWNWMYNEYLIVKFYV